MWPHCFLPDDKQGDLDGKKADGKAERRAGGGLKGSDPRPACEGTQPGFSGPSQAKLVGAFSQLKSPLLK